MNKAIITSLLDTDLYKFTMQQCALRQFSDVWVKYVFKSRKVLDWTMEMHDDFCYHVDAFCKLRFTEDELNYIASLRFIKKDYIEFLKLYRPLLEHINIVFDKGQLIIKIEGPWYQTILWEIPILAIVSEVYYKHSIKNIKVDIEKIYEHGENKLKEKIKNINNFYNDYVKKEVGDCDLEFFGFKFSDFGTRRRFSHTWHDRVVSILYENIDDGIFMGTSNVYFAKKHDILSVGTNAHEYYQIGQALPGVQLAESQKYMLQSWVNEYRGDLGIALTDTLGSDKFINDFDLYFAKLYDGVRHDSGDPIVWGHKILEHYKDLRIDPRTKMLLYSDSLDFEKAFNIYKTFNKKARISFGIGTHLTNDFSPILNPLNIVIKLEQVNDRPVAKISDDIGKQICVDNDFLEYLKKTIK